MTFRCEISLKHLGLTALSPNKSQNMSKTTLFERPDAGQNEYKNS